MMTTADHTDPQPDSPRDVPRQSILFKATGPVRRSSPDAMRQSVMVLLALAALGISGYYAATLPGLSTPRLILAFLCAGWLSALVLALRGITPVR